MHSFGYFNLSINPENILISECVKLTDFGLKMESGNKKPKRDTRYYIKDNIKYIINAYTSPEELDSILNNRKLSLSKKTDSWNCGILLYEMLTDFKSPFKGETDEEFFNSIFNCQLDLSCIQDDFCRELISKLVKKNPEERIDIDDILNMEEIKNIVIEQPEINEQDNIINPIENPEEEKEKEKNKNEITYMNMNSQKYISEIKSLKLENEELKKGFKKVAKLYLNLKKKTKNPEEKTKIEEEGDDESLNLEDLMNEEEQDEEKNKEDEKKAGETKEDDKKDEEDDDFDFDFYEELDKEVDEKIDNLYTKCQLYKEQNSQIREKMKKFVENYKNVKKEAENLKNEKNLKILDILENVSAIPLNNMNDLANVINESLKTFKKYQISMKNAVNRLIDMTKEQNEKIAEENKIYLEQQTQKFFNIINLTEEPKKEVIQIVSKNPINESNNIIIKEENNPKEDKDEIEIYKKMLEENFKEKEKILEENKINIDKIKKELEATNSDGNIILEKLVNDLQQKLVESETKLKSYLEESQKK